MPVYLLHFDRPVSPDHTSQHYLGFAETMESLQQRLIHHEDGNGARITAAAAARGIGFECVRVWRRRGIARSSAG